MGDEERCRCGGRTLPNENCEVPAEDGLPAQCVGTWARLKHDRLRTYLAATRAVRRQFLRPVDPGGAAFIDLFAGPGRVRFRDSLETELGSALIAQAHAESPFTHLLYCELNPDNAGALRERTKGDARVHIIEGDCNERIDDIIALVPPNGLNLAFFDPFGAKVFHWETIERLARVLRMDLLFHFPTAAVKRNLLNPTNPEFGTVIDRMMGTRDWREQVHTAKDVTKLIDVLRARLVTLGYDAERVNTLPVTNNQGALLYHLVFAAKDKRGTAIWKSISKHHGAQRGLF